VQLGADVDGVCGIDRAAAFLDMLDLAFLVHDEGGAVGELHLLIQDAVGLGDFPLEVAQQRELDPDFFGKGFVRGRVVNADAENFRVVQVDFAGVDTRLVSLQLLRSTTGKGQHVKGQDDVLLPAEIGEMDLLEGGVGQREVRGHIAHLQVRVRDGGLLPARRRKHHKGSKAQCHCERAFHLRVSP
jgi:hypothetical protein